MAAIVVAISLARLMARQGRANLDRSIAELVTSSEVAESEGDVGKALVALDAAIQLRAGAADGNADELEAMRQRRRTLSRREASAVLDRLTNLDPVSLPLGDWLNLEARVRSDRDLAEMIPQVQAIQRRKLQQRIGFLLDGAKASVAADRPADVLIRCDTAWALSPHLAPDEQADLRARIQPIIDDLIARRGILVEPVRGQVLSDRKPRDGDRSLPRLDRALASRGYVPQPEASPWRDRWTKAPYRLVIERNERHDGTYLTSENRLTKIDARLVLLKDSRPIWETTPSVRTPVPLPKLPAYLSGHLALSAKRIPEFEQLLYDHARTAMNERLAFAVDHMPACGQSPR